MRPRHGYVGVSGVVRPSQQAELSSAAQFVGLDRRLLLGVKATHKTLMLGQENKYGTDWYPISTQLPGALAADVDSTMRVAQVYAEPSLVISDPAYLQTFVDTLTVAAAPWLTHVQFDMLPWHTHPRLVLPALESLAERGLGVLLQVHGPAMSELGPARCVTALAPFRAHLTDVLFDSSHGTGTALDLAALSPFVRAAHDGLDAGVGVAGGLDADRVGQLGPLVAEFPDLSWDAEGRLHPRPGGRLDLPVAAAYLSASAAVLDASRTIHPIDEETSR